MATLRETIERLGVEIPPLPVFRTEDIPYLMMASLLPIQSTEERLISVTNLLIAFAFRIEDLEKELFEAKWNTK